MMLNKTSRVNQTFSKTQKLICREQSEQNFNQQKTGSNNSNKALKGLKKSLFLH